MSNDNLNNMSNESNDDNKESKDTKNNENVESKPIKKLSFKKIIFSTALCILIFLGVILFLNSIFIVDEKEQALITRFGKVTKVIVNEKTESIENAIHNNPEMNDVDILEGKGIFFKAPIIDNVETFDSRLLTYDTSPREVTTKDKKKLILDNNAQWRIENPLLFRMTVKNIREAHTRLDDIIFSKLNEKIGQTEAHVLIADKDFTYDLLENVTTEANEEISKFGIKVADIKIKRTDLPVENSENIFNRMKTEREQKAKQYRSEGKEEAQKIKSDADKQAVVLEAQAYAEAEKVKGEGDAEATRIYNESYSKDPEFYEFYKTLQTYKKTLNGSKIVIDSNSEFLKHLMGGTVK